MPKSEKNGYRGVEYNVRRIDDGMWQWAAYPKKEQGAHSDGREENEDRAIAACKAYIDGLFAVKNSN